MGRPFDCVLGGKGERLEKIRYTLKDLSSDLSISVKDLRKYVNKGILSASKVGRSYLVTHADLDDFLSNHFYKLKNNGETAKRNYLCVYYDKCLDEAAHANKSFYCKDCQKFSQAQNMVAALWDPIFG